MWIIIFDGLEFIVRRNESYLNGFGWRKSSFSVDSEDKWLNIGMTRFNGRTFVRFAIASVRKTFK